MAAELLRFEDIVMSIARCGYPYAPIRYGKRVGIIISWMILFLIAACAGQGIRATPEPREMPASTAASPGILAQVPPALSEHASGGITMVEVPAGAFLMGSDPELDPHAFADEMPPHRVYLDAFRISRYEITNAQYALCVSAKSCELPDNLVYYGDQDYADHPVVFVSWRDAQAFCDWIGGRLPTEAEWEYAARGPQGWAYPWGDEFDCSRGNFGGQGCDGYAGTAPVGSFESGASWRGVQDLAGNVWEWVADWYAAYPAEAQENPGGPESGDYKVLRGGLWNEMWDCARSANRFHYGPDARYEGLLPSVPNYRRLL